METTARGNACNENLYKHIPRLLKNTELPSIRRFLLGMLFLWFWVSRVSHNLIRLVLSLSHSTVHGIQALLFSVDIRVSTNPEDSCNLGLAKVNNVAILYKLMFASFLHIDSLSFSGWVIEIGHIGNIHSLIFHIGCMETRRGLVGVSSPMHDATPYP